MEVSEKENQSKKNRVLILVTYVLGLVFLLVGLFVPLFDGGKILALQLPKALNAVLKKEVINFGNDFAFANSVLITFGKENFSLDFLSLTVVLYAGVTLLTLLTAIPVGICFKKETNADKVIVYIVQTLSVVVLSLYVIAAFSMPQLDPNVKLVAKNYNILIALGGTLITLIILSLASKKATGVAKAGLFVLSLLSLLAVFSFFNLLPSAISDKISATLRLAPSLGQVSASGVDGSFDGYSFLVSLFNVDLKEILSLSDAMRKIFLFDGIALSVLVVTNYVFDVFALATNAKKFGLFFNIVRYALEFIAAAAFIVLIFILKYQIGLFIAVIAAVGLIRLLISVLRFVFAVKKARTAQGDEEFKSAMGENVSFVRPTKPVKQKVHPEFNERKVIEVTDENEGEINKQEERSAKVNDENNKEKVDNKVFGNDLESSEEEVSAKDDVTLSADEKVDDTSTVEPTWDSGWNNDEPKEKKVEPTWDNGWNNDKPKENKVSSLSDSVLSNDKRKVEQPAPAPVEDTFGWNDSKPVKEEKVKPAPVKSEPTTEQPKPVQEQPKLVTEEVKPAHTSFADTYKAPVAEQPKPVAEQPKLVTEEVKPAHTPFADTYKAPVAEQPKPVAEQPKLVTEEVKPAHTPFADTYKAPTTEQPKLVAEQPKLVTEEVKPAHTPFADTYKAPTTEQPKPVEAPRIDSQTHSEEQSMPKHAPLHGYTVGADGELVYALKYGGPTDEFMSKLTNDERIEFAMAFIERKKGDLGRIPEYVIGGNNKKFFTAVFIYLGRIRGIISDGLLNKMFKELNML